MQCKYCGTSQSELRRRQVAGGSIQLVQQCTTCGRATSSAIKQSLVRNPERLPKWDAEAESRYTASSAEESAAQRAKEHAAFLAEHTVYLRSPAWRARRAAVMARACGICEGCRQRAATQVHHLSYDHWKDELLWELVAVCDDCHERAHSNKKAGA
jgi:protein-arginine kinase activator protein McsA